MFVMTQSTYPPRFYCHLINFTTRLFIISIDWPVIALFFNENFLKGEGQFALICYVKKPECLIINIKGRQLSTFGFSPRSVSPIFDILRALRRTQRFTPLQFDRNLQAFLRFYLHSLFWGNLKPKWNTLLFWTVLNSFA